MWILLISGNLELYCTWSLMAYTFFQISHIGMPIKTKGFMSWRKSSDMMQIMLTRHGSSPTPPASVSVVLKEKINK